MKEPQQRFTGIFLPAEILACEDLNLFETILLSWIDALYCPAHGGCFASNKYLGDRIKGAKENTVAKALTHLRTLGLIEDVSFDGRTRVIRACINKYIDKVQSNAALDKNPIGVGQKSNADLDKNPSSPYLYSKAYIKEKTTTGSVQKAYSKKASEKSVVVSFANENLKKERPTYATISADEKVKVDACLEKAKLKNPISNEGGWKQKCIDEGWHLQTPDNPQENVRVNKELAEKIERELVPHPMQSVHATPKNLIIIKHSKSYEVPYEEEPQSFVERIKRLLPNLKTSLVVEQVGNHLC